MRCLACNVRLSDSESTRKYSTGEYIDLCDRCYEASDIESCIERDDLNEEDEDGTSESDLL